MNEQSFLDEKQKKVASNGAGFTVVEIILIVVAIVILIGIIFGAVGQPR